MNSENKKVLMHILTDTSSIPNTLLDHYRELGLNAEETLFLIVLLRLQRKRPLLTFRIVAKESVYSEKEVKEFVPILIDRGFLSLGNEGEIILDGIIEKFLEVQNWQAKKAEQKIPKEHKSSREDKAFSTLYHCFEQEMGRPLSPMEGEQITYWYKILKIPAELIEEGLRRAVLKGVCNFRYIGAILTSWNDRGMTSLDEVEKAERTQKSKPVEAAPRNSRRIFRGEQDKDEIYSDDIYEVF